MHILTIANHKGGVGKTTLTSLFAFYLAERHGARVALIDIDPQRNLSHTMRAYAAATPATAFFEAGPIELCAERQAITLFAATPELANLDIGTEAMARERVQTFATQLGLLATRFDWCLIDPPPALGVRMIAAMGAAHYVAVPIELEEYSKLGMQDMLKAILGTRQQWNPRLKFLGILANRVMGNAPRQRAALEELYGEFSSFMLPARVPTRAAIPRALEQGLPVWRLPGGGREAGQEVIAAFDTVMAKVQPQSVNASGVPA